MANVITINSNDIEDIVLCIKPFKTVRKDAFIRFISLCFGCEENAAKKITQKLLKKRAVFQGVYAGYKIIRSAPEALSDMAALDAFEAYVAILEAEKEQNEKAGVYIMHVTGTEFPHDYLFATTTGTIYEVIVYNEKGFQKVTFAERSSGKTAGDVVKLVVITKNVSPEEIQSLDIKGKHRFALVKEKDKKVVCGLTEIMEGASDD